MKRKSLSFCVVLSLSMIAMTRAVMADPPDRVERVKLDGWQEVAEGVLQRTMGDRVETFSFGEEGMRWSTERIKERIDFLQGEYDEHPSEDLAKLIEDLELQVEERERSLRISRATAADSFGGGEALAACNLIYDAAADAYGLSGSSAPGNGATAYARWYSECGDVGSTFAYAYARATDTSGRQTTRIEEDPQPGLTRSGTDISSAATVSAPGDRDCFSEAFAKSWSLSLNIDYSVSDSYHSCTPPPAVSISTSADLYEVYRYNCQEVTWLATVSGGTPAYSYRWYIDGVHVGSGSSHTETYCGNDVSRTETVNTRVVVTDGAGESASATTTISIRYIGYSNGCSTPPPAGTNGEDC